MRVREPAGDNTGVISEAADAVDAFARGEPKRGRPRATSKANVEKQIARAKAELDGLAAERWSRAMPNHFVALYAKLHEDVYGVAPVEVAGREFFGAQAAAGKLLREEFGGRSEDLIEFMRWTWRRERDGERRRKASGRASDWRVTWQQQFVSRRLLTDYRIAIARSR